MNKYEKIFTKEEGEDVDLSYEIKKANYIIKNLIDQRNIVLNELAMIRAECFMINEELEKYKEADKEIEEEIETKEEEPVYDGSQILIPTVPKGLGLLSTEKPKGKFDEEIEAQIKSEKVEELVKKEMQPYIDSGEYSEDELNTIKRYKYASYKVEDSNTRRPFLLSRRL